MVGNLDDLTLDGWTVRWLAIWTIGLWTVGPFHYNLIQIDDYPADSCAISHTTFFLIMPKGVLQILTICFYQNK